MKLYTEGPAILAQRHRYPRTSLTGPESTGLRLKLSTTSALPYSIKEGEEEHEEEGSEELEEEEYEV
jgi:hypothetical protein